MVPRSSGEALPVHSTDFCPNACPTHDQPVFRVLAVKRRRGKRCGKCGGPREGDIRARINGRNGVICANCVPLQAPSGRPPSFLSRAYRVSA